MPEKQNRFSSTMTARERIAALAYIPVHVYLLPRLLGALPFLRAQDSATINVIYYAVGAAYMLVLLWRFWRREFDALCDYGPAVLLEVLKAYGTLLLCNMAVNLALLAMFRGGVFGLLRRYSRAAAYGASMLLFAVYHIWAFAAGDAAAWLYVLQYLPAGFLLARVYEKTDSIWTGVFLHMTVNGVSMLAVSALGAYL